MRVKILTLMFVFGLFTGSLTAQTKLSVTGSVTDEGGLPMPGVNVVVKGTARGVSTDFDGKYQIQASANEVLEFSYLGYVTQEKIVVGGVKR